jgi:hypothetical protein
MSRIGPYLTGGASVLDLGGRAAWFEDLTGRRAHRVSGMELDLRSVGLDLERALLAAVKTLEPSQRMTLSRSLRRLLGETEAAEPQERLGSGDSASGQLEMDLLDALPSTWHDRLPARRRSDPA